MLQLIKINAQILCIGGHTYVNIGIYIEINFPATKVSNSTRKLIAH